MHLTSPYPSGTALRSSGRFAGPAPGGRLLRAALGYLLAFTLTAVGFVWTAAGQRLDGALLPRAERGGGYEQPTDLVEPAKTVLFWFGDPAVLGLLLVGVLVLGVLARRPWAGVMGIALVGATAVLSSVAKQVILRPDLAVATSTTHNSFPSGHVSVAMALLLAVLLVLPAPARWWFAVPGAMGVSVVAAATMIAGWHRFSDVCGGVLLVAVLFCLAAAPLARSRDGVGPGAGPAGVLVGLLCLLGGVAVLGLLGGVAVLGLLGGEPLVAPDAASSGPGGMFVAIMTGSGLIVLVVVTILVLVRSADFVGPVRKRRMDPVHPVSAASPRAEPDSGAAEGRWSPQDMIHWATSDGMR
ncbi:phosphatase PAP2 family protein [Plantactinospora sp. S1510]|uniref:Phosphatase PAP2 family protein n=1 Tax=Plantactinospora alkalitolerans TaxID=2789879 RepID=A0ABS0GNZ5_9ACTN|nr:phosphatase PAP2 family protein [Plantactinospora alkalitolerans]MBF9127900.1 phosphatase PAP2 family protein [Plantactinospora alkalitolerans]